jgi:LAO/AO transport system kinase
MSRLEQSPDIFIRSMATRGQLGGVAGATADVVTVLDAAHRDPIIVETVGVGQDEIEIVGLADISIVVLVPGMGDDVQALKAGILEIGDIFVINKHDHPGSEQLERALKATFSLASDGDPDRERPVIMTVATRGEGIEELAEAIDRVHRDLVGGTDRVERRRRAIKARLRAMLEQRLVETALEHVFSNGEYDAVVDAIARRDRDPYSVVEEIIRKLGLGSEP